jgi:hypothetical protein
VTGPADQAPAVTPTLASRTLAHGVTGYAASSLFNYADADSDAATKYSLWDTEGNGHWVVRGVAQATNSEIVISAAEMTQTDYLAGAAGTTDHLYVRAFDGSLWSPSWAAFTVTAAPDQAPTVTATAASQTLAHGVTSVAASSLFTKSDGDGDTITKYGLWDTEGNGHWVVNGVAQATNAEIIVAATDLANTFYVPGATGTTDHLYARAYDGTLWSPSWAGFTVTAGANQAPVVAGGNMQVTAGTATSARGLFTETDANSDAIIAYQFFDGNAGATSGYFVVDGAAQTANHSIDVLASHLSQASFIAGIGGSQDQIWERAFDGISWSDWHAATVTSS